MKKLRKIVLYGHPLLRQKVSPVEIGSPETKRVANILRARLSTVDGYGLAANQLGLDMQMFAYRENAKGKFVTVLNPTIEEYDDETFTFKEGCLSIPNFWWDITRPKRVLLKGYDLDGNDLEIEAEDVHARIFQHEIDHFNGRLVIDHLPKDELADFQMKWYVKFKYLEKPEEDEFQDNAE